MWTDLRWSAPDQLRVRSRRINNRGASTSRGCPAQYPFTNLRERYVNRILRNVIAMAGLAEARGVQLKNCRPLSFHDDHEPSLVKSACSALLASHSEHCDILV